jgi:hypothetical protein
LGDLITDVKEIFVTAWGIVAVAAGAYGLLGAWFPRFRGRWKGSDRVVAPLSSAGFGLFFLCLGLAALCGGSTPRPVGKVLVVLAVSGWILVFVGAALDARTRSRSSFRLPDEPRVRSAEENRAWLFIAFGVCFLSIILWMLLSHR